jgi:hypothetical protein
LQVDDELPARGVAEPGATLLNTNARLWIGELYFKNAYILSFPKIMGSAHIVMDFMLVQYMLDPW